MSGGTFNYLAESIEYGRFNDAVEDAIEELGEMIEYCTEAGQMETAQKLVRHRALVETALERISNDEMLKLIHAVEWVASGDWGWSQVPGVGESQSG